MTDKKKLIMAVDGNSLVHRSYHALESTGLRDAWGRPTWAVKGMLNQLCAAADRVRPDAIVVGFDTPGSSVRKSEYPDYKATRSEKSEDLITQLDLSQKMLAWAGFAVCAPAGLEADDVTATAAKLAGEHGWEAVIVTSDRDAFAHISDHTRVLRIINGGVEASPLVTPDRLVEMYGIRPEQYLDFAAVRGDASDNLPGIKGIGEKTLVKLFTTFPTMEAVWDAMDTEEGVAQVQAAIGKGMAAKLVPDDAIGNWFRNINIMRAVTDLDLGIDLASETGHGMLPLAPEKLTEACEILSMKGAIPMMLDVLGGGYDRSSAPHSDPGPAQAPAAGEHLPPLEEPDYGAPAPEAVEVEATPDGLHPAAAAQLF